MRHSFEQLKWGEAVIRSSRLNDASVPEKRHSDPGTRSSPVRYYLAGNEGSLSLPRKRSQMKIAP